VAADIDAWRPDLVLVNGDVVNDGPSNPACWRYMAQRRANDGWIILRGNHEEYVAEWRDPAMPRAGPAYDLIRLSHWTFSQLNGDIDELAALPDRWDWRPPGTAAPGATKLVAMHGTLLGNRAGIYPFTGDEDVRRRIERGAAVFVTAHTHVPHTRILDGTLIVNTGSVGAPGDGDGRAAYGRFNWTPARGWRACIVRVAYDRAAAERDYTTSGFLAEAGPEAELSLLQFRLARDLRTSWAAAERERILAGEVSLAASLQGWLTGL
jgi:predicted phosphodiesterase